MVSRAVSSWSLHRTLGRFISGDGPVIGNRFPSAPRATDGLPLLDLPAALRARGFDSLQLCHFHLPTRAPEYLNELRISLAESQIELEAVLVDDGDVTNPDENDVAEAWLDGWLDTASALGARRVRLSAGRSAPTAETIQESATRLARLATMHPEIRVVTENWLGMMPDANAVCAVMDAAGPNVGLLIDLGNWSGPEKYQELARIAPRAETCHAKCHFRGVLADVDDFRESLSVLNASGYGGPLALIYDGGSDDEWSGLETEFDVVREVFPT